MAYTIKIIAQLEDTETGEVLEQLEVQQKQIALPSTFDDFGLRHKEQVELIKNSQDFILKFECKILTDNITCPMCGKRPHKQGMIESDFHDVYTDHKVKIQRLNCTCGWRNKYTLNNIYGNAIHPELAQLQSKHASNNSFKKASEIINDFSCSTRKINNGTTIARTVNKVGTCLNEYKRSDEWSESNKAASELVIVVDGGHVQDKEIGKHSFEEIVTTVFKPENLIVISNERREIKHKISVASAKKDSQYNIKKLTINACLRSGMNDMTKITALTDGAKNCWSIINALSNNCEEIIRVLDWFHIGKKFKERESQIPMELKELYNKGKMHLWHGRPNTSITRLNQLVEKLSNKDAIKKLKELIKYISSNKNNIVNYHMRRINNLPYSSQLAESSVNCIINERQKNKKMQWSRVGANNILEIRTSLFSRTWQQDWKIVKSRIYNKAA